MIRLAWAISLLAISTLFAQPRVTYRIENDAMFTNIAPNSLSPSPYFQEDWYETYRSELRVFVKGTHERRMGYRVEPRFWFTHQSDSSEKFDWTLDQGYGYLNPSPRVTFLMGKQRAHWGTGLTYTPTDNLQPAANPLDPTRYLEGAYLARVDATLPWFSISAFYSPDRGDDSLLLDPENYNHRMAGVRLYKLVGTLDLYASAMSTMDRETNYGTAFSWDAGPMVLYGEAAWMIPETATLRHYFGFNNYPEGRPRAVLGASKLIGNSSVYGEVFFNGWGLTEPEYADYLAKVRDVSDISTWIDHPQNAIKYTNLLLLSKPTKELHQVYVAGNGTYNWRDLWTFSGNVIYEPGDQTLYGYPIVSFIGYPNINIAAGVSFAAGSPSSELPLLPSYFATDLRFVIFF